MAYVFFTALAVLILFGPVAAGRAGHYYAAPSGDDRNDCMTPKAPCQSAQAAVRKMPLGLHRLTLAPGRYDEIIDVSHGRQVSIHGPHNDDGSCGDATLVTVSRIMVQDNATIWAHCLSTGQVGCRQWAIADVIDVILDGTAGLALVANETCRINTAGTLWLNGQVDGFAYASNYSTIYVGGAIDIRRPDLKLAYFLRAVDATLDLSEATFSGHPLASGLRFTLDHGVIILPHTGAAIPGDGFEMINLSVCRRC
jgi:hypothetical protein